MNSYFELEYLDLIADLKQLRSVKPGTRLRIRIGVAIATLPAHSRLPLLPVHAVRLLLIMLLLTLLTGSGLVAASQKSQPGHILYPLNLLSHKFTNSQKVSTVSPLPGKQVEGLAQEPAASPPESSDTPESIGGTEVVLLPKPTPSPLLEPSPTPSTSAEIEADLHVNLNATNQLEPSPSPSPTAAPSASPTPVVDLPLLDIDQTESGLELKVGKENNPFFKIGL